MDVHAGQKIVVFGPSGSGKSTLIRCINRLEEHSSGRLIVEGTELTEDTQHIRKIRQEIGMVFQQFNLFPHLTVLENLTIGPIKVRKMSKSDAESLARTYLDQIIAPTLITCGRYDELGPSCAATLQTGLPNAKTVIFENSAHVSHIEEETAYLTNLREFLTHHDG